MKEKGRAFLLPACGAGGKQNYVFPTRRLVFPTIVSNLIHAHLHTVHLHLYKHRQIPTVHISANSSRPKHVVNPGLTPRGRTIVCVPGGSCTEDIDATIGGTAFHVRYDGPRLPRGPRPWATLRRSSNNAPAGVVQANRSEGINDANWFVFLFHASPQVPGRRLTCTERSCCHRTSCCYIKIALKTQLHPAVHGKSACLLY